MNRHPLDHRQVAIARSVAERVACYFGALILTMLLLRYLPGQIGLLYTWVVVGLLAIAGATVWALLGAQVADPGPDPATAVVADLAAAVAGLEYVGIDRAQARELVANRLAASYRVPGPQQSLADILAGGRAARPDAKASPDDAPTEEGQYL